MTMGLPSWSIGAVGSQVTQESHADALWAPLGWILSSTVSAKEMPLDFVTPTVGMKQARLSLLEQSSPAYTDMLIAQKSREEG